MLGRCLRESHRVGSAICYWILIEKGRFISLTTVWHLAADKPREPNIREWIRDDHGSLEAALGNEDFGTSLYGYDSFINDDGEGTVKGDPN